MVTDLDAYEADIVVVALGADYDVAATPGLAEVGNEFYSVAGAEAARGVLADFSGGRAIVGERCMLFKCPPAPSEAALLLDELLRSRGARDDVTIQVAMPFVFLDRTVPRDVPEVGSLARFAERDIEFLPGHMVASFCTGCRTEAVLDNDARLPFDLFLGVPVHRAPEVVVEAGMTGMVGSRWNPHTLATAFLDVYAVGDVTSVGTPKAGTFAEGAALVVANQLIARVRGDAEPPGFDGTGACWNSSSATSRSGASTWTSSRPPAPRSARSCLHRPRWRPRRPRSPAPGVNDGSACPTASSGPDPQRGARGAHAAGRHAGAARVRAERVGCSSLPSTSTRMRSSRRSSRHPVKRRSSLWPTTGSTLSWNRPCASVSIVAVRPGTTARHESQSVCTIEGSGMFAAPDPRESP